MNTEIGGSSHPGSMTLKTIAVSRLVLDNFQHIKAYWIMLGEKIPRSPCSSELTILTAPYIEEKIAHMAGGMTGGCMTRDELVYLIRKAGKVPVGAGMRFYNHLRVLLGHVKKRK